MLVTGITGKAGKTTALESISKSSKAKVIVFSTKIGEKSFLDANKIAPFFKEENDWQYIEGLIEATMKEKVSKSDRARIIKLSKQTTGRSLLEFKTIVDSRIKEDLSVSEDMMLTNLQAYLEIIVPRIQRTKFSDELNLVNGINIINLENLDEEVQSLIVSSVLNEILKNHHDTIAVLPESWKFLPQKRGNPCKAVVEKYIRQGATNGNYIWIDSQDMTNIDKTILKQISEWVLGYQAERNEVKYTIDQIPLPKVQKPSEEKIMTLGKGMFYFASRDLVSEVYIQPFWLDDASAIKIAKGELSVSDKSVMDQFISYKSNLRIEKPVVNNSEKSIEEQFEEYKIKSKKTQRALEEKLDDALYRIDELKVKSIENEVVSPLGIITKRSSIYV